MTVAESFDVIVVGARCAGSPLAALLARAGLRVAVVEQATFPRDTLSTHCLHADALAFLDRLGVTRRVRATGAPYLRSYDLRQDDLEIRAEIPQRPGDVGGIASVRRMLLDPILADAAADAAADAGADIRMGTKVTGLLEDHGRVTGVNVTRNGSARWMTYWAGTARRVRWRRGTVMWIFAGLTSLRPCSSSAVSSDSTPCTPTGHTVASM
jgi:2-polyprenyl-6-methoxyphenol hydroxylase-like FAD-dependent oxidoreductase